uniref:SFRICE_038252 n=1 Tax=Spodoptera frugiperda TaxID=7108 RepID=A0A2H1VCG1_SPOFR
MWTGILNGKMAFELPDVLNAEIYLNFLQNQLPNLLEDMPLSIFRDMWFQQDGCPAHYSRSVRQFLDEEYSGRWIEGGLALSRGQPAHRI